jgi:hypothetical protein
MQHYRVFSPGIQVRGQVIQAATKCLNPDHLEPYLRQNGLLGRQDDLQPILDDRWYSQQDWLNVLSALIEANVSSARFDLVSVGMTLADMLTGQPGFETLSLEEKFEAWSRIFTEQHRDGDPGKITVHRMGSNAIWVDTQTPYPDDILYGALYAIAFHHFPKGAVITVRYDDHFARRDKGGDVTRFEVVWE